MSFSLFHVKYRKWDKVSNPFGPSHILGNRQGIRVLAFPTKTTHYPSVRFNNGSLSRCAVASIAKRQLW